MSSLTRENAGSPGQGFRMLSRSADRTSLEASSSERRADKLLVRSSHRIVCSLVNSASHVVYYLEAKGMNALDGTQCSLQILLAMACGLHWGQSLAATGYGQGSSTGTGVSLGDSSIPADSHSWSWATLLASSHRRFVSIIMVSMRLDSMFQCPLEGGLRGTAILGPCHMLANVYLCKLAVCWFSYFVVSEACTGLGKLS